HRPLLGSVSWRCRWIISFTPHPASLDRPLGDVLSHFFRLEPCWYDKKLQITDSVYTLDAYCFCCSDCWGFPVQRVLIIAFFIAATAVPASAQERPFIFSIVTESE